MVEDLWNTGYVWSLPNIQEANRAHTDTYINTGRILTHLTSSQVCASRRPVRRLPRGAYKFFSDESADNIWNEGK
jgi:hypothetical protein